MPAPSRSASDLLAQFMALLPRGRIWQRDPEAVAPQAYAALMPTYARLCERDANLLVDAFPASTVELLPEWEASLGLPDPCAGEAPSLELRQVQVVARLANVGGASVPYFVSFAAALGYTVSITEYSPAYFGRAFFGTPFYSDEWAHVWTMTCPAFTVVPAYFGDFFGEAWASWGNQVLVCEVQRAAPAHTIVTFATS